MNLTELGFHKTAGAQADAYKLLREYARNFYNVRNIDDMVMAAKSSTNAFNRIDPEIANALASGKSGLFSFMRKPHFPRGYKKSMDRMFRQLASSPSRGSQAKEMI